MNGNRATISMAFKIRFDDTFRSRYVQRIGLEDHQKKASMKYCTFCELGK